MDGIISLISLFLSQYDSLGSFKYRITSSEN